MVNMTIRTYHFSNVLRIMPPRREWPRVGSADLHTRLQYITEFITAACLILSAERYQHYRRMPMALGTIHNNLAVFPQALSQPYKDVVTMRQQAVEKLIQFLYKASLTRGSTLHSVAL